MSAHSVQPITRAVVTGGAGFLGVRLCERLLEEGASVVCVDNFATGNAANVDHLADRSGFRLIEADLRRPLWVPGPIDAVFHLACAASPADYLRLPVETLETGSLGTGNALRLAEAHGARLVLASTSEVYGDPLQYPQRESYWGNVNPVGPRSVYDEAKRFAESLAMAHHRARGTDVGIARIFNSYGPGMRADDGRVVPTFITQALRGESLTVHGDGLQTRSICYIDDTVSGVLALARSGETGPINLGSPYELSILRLAQLIRSLTRSKSPIVFVGRPEDDPRFRRPDVTLAWKLLGWKPEVFAEEGLRRTIAWFAGSSDGLVPGPRRTPEARRDSRPSATTLNER